MASEFRLVALAKAICERIGCQYVRPVGRGAFKETFEIVNVEGRALALKVLTPGQSASTRVTREIEASMQCQHPHIVKPATVAEFAMQGGGVCIYIVEEFLAGGTLEQYLARTGPLEVPQLRQVAAPLISALAHLASRGLVHRDIKPANIMLRDSGDLHPVLVDFGIVRPLGETSLTGTDWAQGPGTPLFAPPEQLVNDKALIDWRSDQFSLGVLLSFARHGKHPYQRSEGESVFDVVSRVAARGKVAAWVAASDVPFLARMVSPWPVERFRRPVDLMTVWGLTPAEKE